MRRSEINKAMREAVKFLEDQCFFMPKFAFWTINDWKNRGDEIQEIIENHLGWDITDYGSGDFSKKGLIHFTIRNGNPKKLPKGGKPYCEKIMIIEEGQLTNLHHHNQKIEDIINRGGGTLMIELYNVNTNNKLDDSPVNVSIDGVKNTLKAGSIIELLSGESITLTPIHYHKFWAKKGYGKVLIGEVSSVNDDYGDNIFLEKTMRFSEIEEDEEPLYLLYDDYKKYLSRH